VSTLLDPLRDDQQLLVDAIADGFSGADYEWPFWDYVDWRLEQEGVDAWDAFQSLPTIGQVGYGAVSWSRTGTVRPNASDEVKLTVVGFAHSQSLRQYTDVFLFLLNQMIETRAAQRAKPRSVREASLSSGDFAEFWRATRHVHLPSPRLTWELVNQEPRLSWGGQPPSEGSWMRTVAPGIREFAGVTSLADYVDRLEALLSPPPAPLPALVPSPLSLAAAIDYLNAIWQLTHDGARLFHLTGAERTTRLAFDIQTADEFAGQLSALTDLLRTADQRVEARPTRRGRNRTLARVEADLGAHLPAEGLARATEAISVLELITALRDAGQHGEAAVRGVAAYASLGLTYPPPDWRTAWTSVSVRAVSALNAIREELAATLQ
jgi:hypothetical protein